ncbi:MAG: hypothetical protein Q8O67_24680 [Deltaproteobacteria bacterium]|nr:hypothetical protein [Deltaproteobacteria bacterium]
MAAAGIRHALCGGLAVGAYARPRATRDIDFLVGEEAYVHHGLLVTMHPAFPTRAGDVQVDAVPLLPNLVSLEPLLTSSEKSLGVPVISALGLVAMKLVAGRMKDRGDVVALVESGAVDPQECRAFLRSYGFEHLVAQFDALVERAEGE